MASNCAVAYAEGQIRNSVLKRHLRAVFLLCGMSPPRLFMAEERKWPVHGQNDANDPDCVKTPYTVWIHFGHRAQAKRNMFTSPGLFPYVPRPLPEAPIERLNCRSDTWERVPISVIGADERSRIASCSRNQAMISFRRPPVGRAHRKTFVSLPSSPIHQYSLTTIKLQSRLPVRVNVKISTANPCC
jgi:hypothetical protein